MFRSKKDLWLGICIGSTCLVMLWAMWYERHIGMYIIGVLTIGFLLWLWFGTFYTIEAGKLIIRSGPLKTTVEVASIKKLAATNSLLSGPALSLHRIEIQYHTYDIAIVSPEDRLAFIQALQKENQTIVLDGRLLDEIKEESQA